MIIVCRTLFDITKTNISNRRKIMDDISMEIIKQRNQQSNYETIIQIISLRSLPENISEPQKIITNTIEWGFKKQEQVSCWEFTFEVQHKSVFSDGNDELGNLLNDCNGVPMINGLDESVTLSNTLSKNNIKFEIVKNETK